MLPHRREVRRPGAAALRPRPSPAWLALVLAAGAVAAGLHGTDQAAQAYRVDVVRLHGLVVWDSGWYGGTYPLGYSVAFPLIGALVGLGASAVAAAGAAAWAFDRLVRKAVGRRTLGSWYFAASTLLAVVIGQLTYLAGEAVALAALLALTGKRPRLGVALGLLAALLSPLAAAFLVLVCALWAVHDREKRTAMAAAAAAAAVPVLVLGAVFTGEGPFPFHWGGLVVVELLCVLVLTPLVRAPRVVLAAAAAYGLASLASFVVPNPVGGNATRLAESVGVPLVACLMTAPVPGRDALRRRAAALRRPAHGPSPAGALRGRAARLPSLAAGLRPPAVALVALAPFVVWQWAPGSGVVASAATVPSNTAAFYAPLLHRLQEASGGRPERVEVVPTADHWESAYVGPHVPLARGWERQVDVADNPVFYRKGALTGRSYRAWLAANGVRLVALPAAPLDYAGLGEAALLRAGAVPGLTLVWSSPTWRLWRVDAGPGMVTGAGTLVRLAPDLVELAVDRPGDLLVRVRYSRFWSLAAGRACVLRAPGGWTEVHAAAAGTVELDVSLVGGAPAACPTPAGPTGG